MGQVNAGGQRSTREDWASSMSGPPPAPGPHAVLKDDPAGLFRPLVPSPSCAHRWTGAGGVTSHRLSRSPNRWRPSARTCL